MISLQRFVHILCIYYSIYICLVSIEIQEVSLPMFGLVWPISLLVPELLAKY